MKIGHGITGSILEQACELGLFRAPGKRVLLEAIWEEHADARAAELMLDAGGKSRANVMDAVAFRVADIGPEVPADWGLRVGDPVLNVSISGERVNSRNQKSPWVVVHYEDIVGIIDAQRLADLIRGQQVGSALSEQLGGSAPASLMTTLERGALLPMPEPSGGPYR